MGKAQLLSAIFGPYRRYLHMVTAYCGIQFTIVICMFMFLGFVASMYLLFCCVLEVLLVLSSDHFESKIL